MWFEDKLRLLVTTSGFRLALRSLALSLGGAVLVFIIIHHAAELAWRGQIDDAVSGALSDILGDVSRDGQPLAANVRMTLAENGDLFYADTGPDGTWRAGNFHLTPELAARWNGMRTWRAADGLTLPPRVQAIRGISKRFPGGETLFIAADATALKRLNALIAQSFLAVFGIILALGLMNAYFAARAALTRVDEFATTIRDIMSGDLSRRIALSAAGDEFDRLAGAMNAMLQRIQELMENLRQVTNDISHDLRSPLARLREHLELSQARFTAPGMEEMFDEALAQLDQALEIFAAMLRIAEVEAGARRAGFAELDVSALLAMLAESYEPSLAAAGLSLHVDIAPNLIMQGDKELLAQLFANLLDNIVLHAVGADVARLHATARCGRIVVTLSDNGAGVPAAGQARLLQRFARRDEARHRPGHGLGLPLAVAIAALHEGSLTLGEAGPGLSVVVSLPG